MYKDKFICIFGDSISWGFFDKEKGGWAERLRLYLGEKSEYYHFVYNLSIDGETTEGLIKRFKSEAKIREADIVVFAIGTNDCVYSKSKKGFLVPEKEFEKNTNRLIKEAKEITNEVFFVGFIQVIEEKTNPFIFDKDLYAKNEDIEEYENILKEICKKENVKFINLKGLLNEEDFDKDGIHPNTRGHKKMFESIKKHF